MMTEDDAPTGRLMRHKEKRQTKVWNKSLETLYQDWMGSVSFRRKWWCGKESNKSIGEACVLRALLFCILGFGLLILFVGILFFSACRHIVSVQASKCNKTLPKCILSQCRKTRVDDNKDFLFSASYKLLAASRIVSQVGHEWWQNLATKQLAGISNALFLQSNLKKYDKWHVGLVGLFCRASIQLDSHATDTPLKYNDNNVAFHVILSKLYEYIKSVVIIIHDSNTCMKDTIVVLADCIWAMVESNQASSCRNTTIGGISCYCDNC